MIELAISQEMLWTVIVGFIIAFILAFGIGANDVANSFGTSVGSRVLTLRQACILACIFETLGAILLGAKVSDTIRKGIIDIEPYKNNTDMLMIGNVAALSGSCVWLLAATLLRLPVSATHSIVGATVGFALVAHGVKGISWGKFGMIVGSWFISPILAGAVSTGIFFICKYFIITKKDPLESGLKFLPVFYAITVVINLFSVFYDGPEMLHLDKIPLWGTFVLSFGCGIVCAIIVRFAIVPWLRRKIKVEVYQSGAPSTQTAVVNEQGEISRTFEYSPISSAGCSQNNSTNNSRRNSNEMIINEKELLPAILEMEMETSCTEKKELPPNAANNLLAPPGVTSTPIKGNKDIDNNDKKHLVNGKPKIDKNEDAPLMDNEYKLGTVTPGMVTPITGKCPTEDELNRANEALANGFKPRASPAGSDVRLLGDSAQNSPSNNSLEEDEKEKFGRSGIQDRPETAKLFSFLQILTAVFGAFAHGGNDVSNAIGPLVSIWLTGRYGMVESKHMTPIWILLYGGVGISLGLCLLGRRVIKTMGDDLSKITPSSGFCIEIGSALTVLVASNVGIPISTTHCKVGSVVFVGRFRSRENVDWSLFRNIVLAWLVTLPVAGGVSAALMAGLQLTL